MLKLERNMRCQCAKLGHRNSILDPAKIPAVHLFESQFISLILVPYV